MPRRNTSLARRAAIVTVALLASLALLPGGVQARGGARALLRNADGQTVGAVQLNEGKDGAVVISAAVQGLTPGFHGFHVHAVGRCEPPFTSAGGHFNPEGTGHGDHAGDMPSLLVMEDGTAWAKFKTDRFSVADLFDGDGSAIIVHAAPDNFAHIPDRYHSHTEDTFGPDSATLATGDAGARVACGVVQ